MCWTRFWAASQKRQNVCPGQLPPNRGLEILSSLANAPGLPITPLGCSCHWVDSPGTHTPPPPGQDTLPSVLCALTTEIPSSPGESSLSLLPPS